jgi:hypothetical protein
MTETDLQLIKDLSKRIAELEKGFKVLSSTINIDALNKEIQKIHEELKLKATGSDIYELKELISKI